MVICNLVLGELIGLVGIVANIVTIIIFIKNGIVDSVDVTLAALAISDIGALITSQFYNIMINPWSLSVQFPFETFEVVTLVSFFPHGYFIRVSGLITSYAAFERCFVLITCTVTIAISLNQSARWRTSLSSEKTEMAAKKATLKERKVVRMLTVVSAIFIVCLIPLSATLTAVAFVNDLSILGPYFKVARLCYSVSFMTETVSSTMNPFVYFKMSSKYRRGFLKLFGKLRPYNIT
ncbi:FMRFamide receptor [Biomphalaria pfeifferi]|uniref:FMRFamide receptor n=1 Tax=Biomphalaria pfeifferi TaxID=112525 RepID=A0AAD8FLY2_BIOPF|nr:FMRFamide receptor [Biomphalaria pfeifferi]